MIYYLGNRFFIGLYILLLGGVVAVISSRHHLACVSILNDLVCFVVPCINKVKMDRTFIQKRYDEKRLHISFSFAMKCERRRDKIIQWYSE